jgi:hypothetical protein
MYLGPSGACEISYDPHIQRLEVGVGHLKVGTHGMLRDKWIMNVLSLQGWHGRASICQRSVETGARELEVGTRGSQTRIDKISTGKRLLYYLCTYNTLY